MPPQLLGQYQTYMYINPYKPNITATNLFFANVVQANVCVPKSLGQLMLWKQNDFMDAERKYL